MQPPDLKRYLPPTGECWKGRIDGPGAERYHEVIKLANLCGTNLKLDEGLTFGFLGFACDEGVRRNQGLEGASLGPNALRKALARLPVSIPEASFYDFGDIACTDSNLEDAQHRLGQAVALLLNRKVRPIIFGGGHEVAWGNYQGIANAFPHQEIAIINFDAHFDLRPLLPGNKGSSGSSFTQIAGDCLENKRNFDYYCIGIQKIGNTPALFRRAEELRVRYVLAEDLHLGCLDSVLEMIDNILSQKDLIYATICMDVFSSSYAPGVSAPQPLGLLPWHVIPLLNHLARSKKVVCLDIAELNPNQDREGMTAQLAAALVSHYLLKFQLA